MRSHDHNDSPTPLLLTSLLLLVPVLLMSMATPNNILYVAAMYIVEHVATMLLCNTE